MAIQEHPEKRVDPHLRLLYEYHVFRHIWSITNARLVHSNWMNKTAAKRAADSDALEHYIERSRTYGNCLQLF